MNGGSSKRTKLVLENNQEACHVITGHARRTKFKLCELANLKYQS